MQARQVRGETLAALEVDVERDEVEERKVQVLRRRIVDVRDEPVGVLVPDRVVKPLEVALDLAAPEPASHRRRDLVAEPVCEQRGMPGDRAHLLADDASDVRRRVAVDQVADVLLGREPDHDAEAVALREVEELGRRHRVRDPDDVDAVRGHLREVVVDRGQVVVLAPVRVRLEGAVADPADAEPVVADAEVLPANARANGARRPSVALQPVVWVAIPVPPRGVGRGTGHGSPQPLRNGPIHHYEWPRRKKVR